MARIKKGDTVKFISGANKGKTGKVSQVNTANQTALVEGFGVRHRHIKPSMLNPRGGHKDVQAAVPLSKLALVVDEKSSKTSRVGYSVADGKKVRLARQVNNKEIK